MSDNVVAYKPEAAPQPSVPFRWVVEAIEATDRGRPITTLGYRLQVRISVGGKSEWHDVPVVRDNGQELLDHVLVVPWKTNIPKL